ncbi:MAG TPA: LuxR C-terminal-related transcriptional regulator, partial [Jatrophihabitantaceae bacterium]|nr:LuxR C-terminal-related transcriptional regulator [Jatrophihabitantaceae bacterium]
TRQLWLTEQTDAARSSFERALALAEPLGATVDHAFALLGVDGFRVLVDDEVGGVPLLADAVRLAQRLGADDIVALSRNYLGSARLQVGDDSGRQELLDSVEVAAREGRHEYVMRAYYNLMEGLWRLGRYEEALSFVDLAEAYGRDRDFPVYAYMVEARRYRWMAMHGHWAEALAGLHEMVDGQGDPGMIGRETLPFLARLLIRRGAPDAEEHLAEATRHADRADVLEWLVPAGLAAIEHAWLSGRPELAGRYPELLLERTDRPGCAVWRGELLRYLKRLGRDVAEFTGCPEQYAAGIRGDWHRAAAAWQELGDPYERALELAESRQQETTVEAMHVLDSLGAQPAATLVRRRLRELGVARLPRRHASATAVNAAGLTARQVEIMRLVADGLSNAEIARLLVVSPRTVDHHVAAVFLKFGVHTRREAAAQFAQLAQKA